MTDAPSTKVASVGLVAGWSFPATVFDPLMRHLAADEVVAFGWSTFATDWLESTRLEPGRLELAQLETGRQGRAESISGPAVWVGWSLGGSLLLEAVRQGRIRPARLVLIQATPRFLAADGWPGVSHGDWQALRRAAGRHPLAAAVAFRRRFDLPSAPAASEKLAAASGLDWLARLDLRSELAAIDVPVDIWLAPDDQLVPVDWPQHLDLPGHVHVHRFEQGGHAAWLNHPVALARSLVRPLTDDPGARSTD
ncbi:alpha/beta fold hydrolase [Guyparkeria halopsychrophila]|uniref:alpha/beta fold hydrolase n=1 Tax=Guyparkeria halopsychrophila TaxID=3139421 RepID=UPI0037CB101C